ncbi:MAG: UDP-N-acetylmuramate dehydrogenase [Bacteroidales bacterium]|nr:UDP-N-acetylmuramate dehydrogenase [Bacteroidales bacterium]
MHIASNFDISNHHTFACRTHTKQWIAFETEEEVVDYFTKNPQKNDDFLIIGLGSNLLFTKDYNHIIYKLGINTIELICENENEAIYKVGAGVEWDGWVEYTVEKNLWGLENLSLIPGTVGASPVQNIGAYGVEVGDVISKVHVVDTRNGNKLILEQDALELDYRHSIFKTPRGRFWMVVAVEFKLSKNYNPVLTYAPLNELFNMNDIVEIQQIRDIIVDVRNAKLPDVEKIGSAGSFFKNPILDLHDVNGMLQDYPQMPYYLVDIDKAKIAAGWLIDQCGWKAYREADAGVYPKQALVLVNYGGASGYEINALAEKITKSVKEKFNIELEREVITL